MRVDIRLGTRGETLHRREEVGEEESRSSLDYEVEINNPFDRV